MLRNIPLPIDFNKCRVEIAPAFHEFGNRWCKWEHVESDALNTWILIFLILLIGNFHLYGNDLDLLLPEPKFTFWNLKKGIGSLI